VPSFVREMRVGRYGIHFYAHFLELCVMVSQVTQFSRANKSEVSWVKHNDRPFAFQIGIRDRHELAVMIGSGFEWLDSGIDE